MRKILLIFLVVLMVLPLSVLPAGAAAASMTVEEFDRTSVKQDLTDTTVDGVKFDTSIYGYNPLGDLKILTFLEFGYGSVPALYLYLYNPQDLNISKLNRSQTITLSMNGSDFEKVTVKLLSSSGTDEHSRLYLKFKVDISSEKINAAFADQESRSYKIGEIELAINGEVKAFGIGGEWVYRGSTAAGDLTSESKLISVIELTLKPLVYRGDIDSEKPYLYDQVNSVYFSMPKDFEKEYGEIKSILCTWTEYDSGWILACKTQDVYDLLNDAIGVKFTDHNDKYPTIFNNGSNEGPTIFSWNPWPYTSGALYFADTLQWLVKYDGSTADTGSLLKTDLREQMDDKWKAYTNNGDSNYFSSGGDKKTVDIMTDQNFTVKVDDGSNWWQKIFSKNHGAAESNGQAFVKVTSESLNDVEGSLLVDEYYKDDLSKDLATAEANNEDLMVLHFASCDYYSVPVKGQGSLWNSDSWVNDGKEDMYACKEQVYMGFDIIQFTCEKDSEKVIVPVAASPINVIGDLQFFDKIKDIPSWVITLIVIALVIIVLLVVSIFFPVFVPVLKALVWLIVLPFKLLWWLLKAVGKGIGALFRKIGQAISNRKRK